MVNNKKPEPKKEGITIHFTISSIRAEDIAKTIPDPSERLENIKRIGQDQVFVGQASVEVDGELYTNSIEGGKHDPRNWKGFAAGMIKEFAKTMKNIPDERDT